MKTYFLNIEPRAKPRMTRQGRWKQTVKEYFQWVNRLQWEAKLKGCPMPLPDRYEVRFQIKPPKSYSKKKVREILGSGHTVKPDWDNLAKALQDALCKDDSHIYRVTVTKVWHDTPGIYILIPD